MTLAARIDRIERLAQVLRDRPGISTRELAALLGVSMRSVARDVDALRERGYPVESSRGRAGGLRLRGNWGIGRVLLTREEALCTLLGLAVAAQLGLPLFPGEMSRARRKIADAFPQGERRRVRPLRERIFVGPAASPAVLASYVEPNAEPMRRLQAAFVEERVIVAQYHPPHREPSLRRLEPHALVINVPAWYLVAFDHTRDAPRTFRLDRVTAVEVLDDTFVPRPREVMRELLADPRIAVEQV
jgi:predicted DNA-binding transcriptional regulator YafY